MFDEWVNDGGPETVTIDSIGSGAGFERHCVAGESDISNASRPIKDSEVEACAMIGRTVLPNPRWYRRTGRGRQCQQ